MLATAPQTTLALRAATQAVAFLNDAVRPGQSFTTNRNGGTVTIVSNLKGSRSFAQFFLSTSGYSGRCHLKAEFTDMRGQRIVTTDLNCARCETEADTIEHGDYACQLFTAIVLALRGNPLTSERF